MGPEVPRMFVVLLNIECLSYVNPTWLMIRSNFIMLDQCYAEVGQSSRTPRCIVLHFSFVTHALYDFWKFCPISHYHVSQYMQVSALECHIIVMVCKEHVIVVCHNYMLCILEEFFNWILQTVTDVAMYGTWHNSMAAEATDSSSIGRHAH